eukprot:11136460-Ditylum_brightwellii.AAC.2
MYVRGYIDPKDKQDKCVAPKVVAWADGVRTLASFASRYLQTAFTGLAMTLQGEWQFLMCMVPGVGKMMDPVEEGITGKFLQALFGSSNRQETDELWSLLGYSVQMAGIGLLNITNMAAHCHKTSVVCREVLVESLLNKKDLAYAAH